MFRSGALVVAVFATIGLVRYTRENDGEGSKKKKKKENGKKNVLIRFWINPRRAPLARLMINKIFGLVTVLMDVSPPM